MNLSPAPGILAAPGFLPPDGDLRPANACVERIRRALNYEMHASCNRSLCPDTPLPAGAAAGRLSSVSGSAASSISLTVLRLPKCGAAAGLPMRSKLLFPQQERARALRAAASVAWHCNARSPLGRIVSFASVSGD